MNLRNSLERLKKDDLVMGSLILFIMINIFNFLNYLYHFLMARFLGPADYGILAVLFSLLYIFSIPNEAIQNILASYSSKLNSRNENEKIKFLIIKSLKKALVLSFFLFFIYLILAFFISPFIKINIGLLIIAGFLIFTSLSLPVIRGALQGQKKFFGLGINMIFESTIKIILAMAMVSIGWKVYGALSAVIIGSIIALIAAIIPIFKLMKVKKEEFDYKGIYNYSLPYFIAILAIVFIYSIDVLIAKAIFKPEIAGVYAVASMLGKIIFFGTLAIGKAMLTLTCEKYENGEKTSSLLKKSLLIAGAISVITLFIYYFFPELIITILFGKEYLAASEIIFFIGLGLSFLSFTNILILYGLSVNKIKKSSFTLLFFVPLEAIALYLFSYSLLSFAISFATVNAIMFIYSVFLIKK